MSQVCRSRRACVDRDYFAEVVALLTDGQWRTPKEIAAKKEADEPGIGAADATVKRLLETHPDTFESRTGDEAKKLGRHPSATVWQLIPTLADAHEATLALQHRTGTYRHSIEDVIEEARRP